MKRKRPEDHVNIYDAKAHLSRLIAEVEDSGRPVIICRNNEPVADLVPHRAVANPLVQDPHLAGAKYRCGPCAGVDERDWAAESR